MNPQVHIAASAVLLVGAAVSPFLMGVRVVEQEVVRTGAVLNGHVRPGRALLATPHAVHADGLQMQGGEGRTQTLPVERTASFGRGVQDTPPATSALPVPAIEYDGSRVVPAALWSAVVNHFPLEERVNAIRVAKCETGATYRRDLIGAAGERGVFQVMERFHGTVPSDYAGQTAQAARIQREHGWKPWSCVQ